MIEQKRTVGVALGGGGVRGLAHVPALEAIDLRGITPSAISGTSMGAIIGAIYASGKSGEEIRHLVEKHIVSREDRIRDLYAKRGTLFKWLKGIRLAWKGSGLLNADGFLRYLIEQIETANFEDLKIPLNVIATDFYSGEPVVFDSGPLLPALKASMSIPGVFVPVEYDGRILVDGGISNNLPYNFLTDRCDVTIAVDVAQTRVTENAEPPNMIEAILGMFDMLVSRVTKVMIEDHPPTLYFRPRLVDIRVLEFDKAENVLRQTEACIAGFKTQLKKEY